MSKQVQTAAALGLAAALLSFVLALGLAPWYDANDTRVRLKMEAPAETEIDICWDQKQAECLPLVPYLEAEKRVAAAGETATSWLAELPPRPAYFVSLVFKSGLHGAPFRELDLDSTTSQYGVLPGIGVGSVRAVADQFQIQDASYHIIKNVYMVESFPGGRFNLIPELKPARSADPTFRLTLLKVWGLIFSIFPLLFILVYGLRKAVKNLGSANLNTRPGGYPWWVILLACAAAGAMLYLVANSSVGLNQYDPLNFLQLASGGGWFSNQRLPGYPLFLGLALRLSGYSLNGVALLQALLLALSTFVCAWALRKWLHPLAALLLAGLILFSPAQVRYARWILRESLFASLVLLGIAALTAHFTSRKPASRIWLAVYALVCMAAFLVRENGILIWVAMLPFLLVETIRRLQAPQKLWARLRDVLRLGAGYALPVLGVVIVYIGFASYNYFQSGYFQVVFLQKMYQNLGRTLFATNFDARSLLEASPAMSAEARSYLGQPLYTAYILARDQVPTLDPTFVGLIPTLNQAMLNRGLPLNSFKAAGILDEIGQSSLRLLPWQADAAGFLRQYQAFIFMNVGKSLAQNDPASLAEKQAWMGGLSPAVSYHETLANPGKLISRYYKYSQTYFWYGALLVLALLASLYILFYEDPIFLAPMAIFAVNGLFLMLTRFVYHRFVIILDVTLILQMVLGLSLWMNRKKPLRNHKRHTSLRADGL